MKKKKPSFYSDEFKLRVVCDVIEGKYSKEEARRIHNIKGKSAVLNWMRKLNGNGNANFPKLTLNMIPNTEVFKMKELSREAQRIKELEEQLNKERLRADLWKKMVEIAEEKFDLDIQKKFGAKQSTPSKSKKRKQ